MNRLVITLPEAMSELCLIRLGFWARSFAAWLYMIRLGGPIARSAGEAQAAGAGLLASEFMRFSVSHVGILQYWESFDALEAWSHKPPHSEWWKGAIERSRSRSDFVIYHETFLVPRASFESIYLNLKPADRVGATVFGERREALGRFAASRDRISRRRGAEGS